MKYEGTMLEIPLKIEEIVTIHYFEYSSDFSFPGESHNFWEFLCVDKGEIEVSTEQDHYTLERGDVIFHKPNEFHCLHANKRVGPNLIVISFICESPSMNFFVNRVMKIGEKEKGLLAGIIAEAGKGFTTPLNDPFTEILNRGGERPFAGEQLIRCYLEQFLIQLVRSASEVYMIHTPIKLVKQKNDQLLYIRIITYLEDNLGSKLSVEKICADNLVGKTQLQRLFKSNCGCGIMEKFCMMKIAAARQMIQDSHYNFSQIADKLGYSSVHYFSRQFKQLSGMTPSEYASSVKALSESTGLFTESINL